MVKVRERVAWGGASVNTGSTQPGLSGDQPSWSGRFRSQWSSDSVSQGLPYDC